MKINKIFAGALVLLAFISAGCSKKAADSEKSDKVKIVTTIFPEYDWVREILGDKADRAELTLLLGNGTDLHSYQPSIQDIAKISDADVFVYVGGESDEWAEDALKNAANKNMKVINLMEVLKDKIKLEELKEGMQEEDEHEHEHGHHHDHEHEGEEAHDEEEEEYDEHVWLSLRNAKVICAEIASALSEKDAANAASYKENLALYSAKLDALDKKYASVVKNVSKNTLVFADRFPFRYLVDDYGLDYFAAFAGCSAETEASFETIVFLANKIDELNLKNVCKIEKGDSKIAKTVISSSKTKNAEILTLDSMQSTTLKEANNGAAYLSIMEKNLKVLEQALK